MEVVSMQKCNYVVLTILCLFINTSLLSAQDDSRWLIPRNRVAKTDLKIVWQFNLPLSGSETLEKLFVADNRLCAISSRNYLTCLNRADGNTIFNSVIAPAGLPLTGMESYKGELITIVGEKLIVINSDSGAENTPTDIAGGVTCPVVRNDSFFYIAGHDRRIHVLRANDKVNAFDVAAENDSPITSVLADQDFVVFATEAGNVICIEADKPKKLWQFDATAAIAGDIVRDANSLFFACRDACVYRLELSSGRLVWKFQTQGILKTSPQPGKKLVYQHVPDVGLIAIDKQNAKILWQVSDGVGLLSESGNKTLVITRTGLLTAMDNTKAKPLYTIDVGGPVKYAINTTDSRIYIGDAKGRLACLEPGQ
jgi:outer membrane protein assembly factor BamB